MEQSKTAERNAVRNIAIQGLERAMHRAGWVIDFIDLDLTTIHPVVTIKVSRADGRWLIANTDAIGRCTLETYQRDRYLGMTPGTKGRRPLSPQVDDVFMGRRRFEGPRSMLRGLTAYLADNATTPIQLSDMRSAWALVMSSPQTPALAA